MALSGGVDSAYLLHRCCRQRATQPELRLRAVHVHHGLLPQADAWLAHCEALCARLSVPLEIIHLDLVPRPGESVEAAAREARYAALRRLIRPGEMLLTAHHQDDQLETVLLQLFRGAGVAGLAAMPEAAPFGRGVHLRPLLGMTRATIELEARQAGLEWVEDPSNSCGRFDRAFLRQQILPPLRGRWPAVASTVSRSAKHLAEAQGLLEELAVQDADGIRDGDRLLVAPLAALSRPRQANLLRWWLRERGLGMPSTARLAAIQDDLLPARGDGGPIVTWKTGELRRYRGRLYALRPLAPVVGGPWELRPGQSRRIEGIGTVSLQPVTGSGFSVGRFPGPFELRLRHGGERLRPVGRAEVHALKKLLQEAAVEPWLRERMPLLWSGGQLLAVGDRWLAAGAAAGPAEPGCALQWARETT
ncbi:MAG: tRNA lysidine(34) synthetase TilS [Gammaproteobacteria bacterium]|nr:MAG: tRNA lysidine(34) synthetase TilS [Gammaproteobacteria bacterium]